MRGRHRSMGGRGRKYTRGSMAHTFGFGQLLLSTALVTPAELRAQAHQPLAFEVASVKPHKSDDNRHTFPQFQAGGRFTTQGIPLRMLIAIAYEVGFQSVRLSGGPGWINSP